MGNFQDTFETRKRSCFFSLHDCTFNHLRGNFYFFYYHIGYGTFAQRPINYSLMQKMNSLIICLFKVLRYLQFMKNKKFVPIVLNHF